MDRFNRVWRYALERYSFYQEWRVIHGLPEVRESIDDLKNFPILRKTDIQKNQFSIFKDAAPCRTTSSGGSTGEPTRFPYDQTDQSAHYSSIYLARRDSGIRPGDAIIMIWGHAHLFGRGPWGRVHNAKRRVMDWLIGTQRLSAYNLDKASLDGYCDVVLSSRGKVLLGYASAIRRLMERMDDRGINAISSKMKSVILTSETVLESDLGDVKRLFGVCPIVEYGMAEAGVIASSSKQTKLISVLWDAFYGHSTSESELVITTLQDVCFPLINYGTGDRVEIESVGPPLQLARVLGRTIDGVAFRLKDQTKAYTHSELITHAVEAVDDVYAFQVIQQGDVTTFRLRLKAGADLDVISGKIRRKLARARSGIDNDFLRFEHQGAEILSIAGKTKFVVRKD